MAGLIISLCEVAVQRYVQRSQASSYSDAGSAHTLPRYLENSLFIRRLITQDAALMRIRICVVKMGKLTVELKHLITASTQLFFFCHRHSATLQGRVGRRDLAGDINACGRVWLSQPFFPFIPLTALCPNPALPIRPIRSITTELSHRYISYSDSSKLPPPHLRSEG